jgi:poly(3-hydroxybutyrate) depolymerase
MNLAHLALTSLCAVTAACVDLPDDIIETGSAPLAIATSNVPGTYRERFTIDGLDREAIVYVPAAVAGATRAPVVGVLHANGSDALDAFVTSGLRERADAEGFIAVFPSALTYCLKEDENDDGDFDDRGERVVATRWSWSVGSLQLCSSAELAMLPAEQRAQADHPLMDDWAFMAPLRARVASRYLVDETRVWLSGVTL